MGFVELVRIGGVKKVGFDWVRWKNMIGVCLISSAIICIIEYTKRSFNLMCLGEGANGE